MSYSNTNDLKHRISYHSRSGKNRNGQNNGYIEQFDNVFFDAIIEKNHKIQQKRDVADQERVKQ